MITPIAARKRLRSRNFAAHFKKERIMKRTEIVEILKSPKLNQEVLVKGWVRSFRANRFIVLHDGSCFGTLQIVVDFEKFPEELLKTKLHLAANMTEIFSVDAWKGYLQCRQLLF